ncbi:MAG: PilZ domain-containing protein [bacterium]|nr:PilZ domain-containing protein [bacterium]
MDFEDKRLAERHPSNLVIEIYDETSKNFLGIGRFRDISYLGVGLSSNVISPKGGKLFIKFLIGKIKVVGILSEVVWYKDDDSKPGLRHYGLRFLFKDEIEKDKLRIFIEEYFK